MRCGSRVRVPPFDILPRKLYSLSVMEHQTAAYGEGANGLRPVAWSLAGDQIPAHTTIHGWDEGMGAHALRREARDVPGSRPHTALVQETETRRPQTRDVAARARLLDRNVEIGEEHVLQGVHTDLHRMQGAR